MSEYSRESVYASLGAGVLVVSIIIAGIFYFSNANSMHASSVPKAEEMIITPTLTPPAFEVPDYSDSAVAAPTALKVAVPNEVRGVLLDPEGRETGLLQDQTVVNDIPFSDYAPDKIAGTVTWILVDNPEPGKYVLKVSGSSEKAIAIYVKADTGEETLELVDVSSPLEDNQSFFFDLDTSSSINSIQLSQ